MSDDAYPTEPRLCDRCGEIVECQHHHGNEWRGQCECGNFVVFQFKAVHMPKPKEAPMSDLQAGPELDARVARAMDIGGSTEICVWGKYYDGETLPWSTERALVGVMMEWFSPTMIVFEHRNEWIVGRDVEADAPDDWVLGFRFVSEHPTLNLACCAAVLAVGETENADAD